MQVVTIFFLFSDHKEVNTKITSDDIFESSFERLKRQPVHVEVVHQLGQHFTDDLVRAAVVLRKQDVKQKEVSSLNKK